MNRDEDSDFCVNQLAQQIFHGIRENIQTGVQTSIHNIQHNIVTNENNPYHILGIEVYRMIQTLQMRMTLERQRIMEQHYANTMIRLEMQLLGIDMILREAHQQQQQPTRTVSPPPITTATEQHDSPCAICLDAVCIGQSIHILPLCGHSFHVACMRPWLSRQKNTCPTCRRPIST